jgi:hypothetical protein
MLTLGAARPFGEELLAASAYHLPPTLHLSRQVEK